MCKKGDIILVYSYRDDAKTLNQHSFIVLEDSGGQIGGLSFDFISLVMSSAKTSAQFKRKMQYDGNLPISASETNVPGGNQKDGYVKCDQFYYFRKDLITYSVIGNIAQGVLDIIIDYINELIEAGVNFRDITDNIEEPS